MLTFLISVASKVYALFGYLWDRVKDAALNALNWAKAEAAKALSAARNWAWDRVQDLRAWAAGWIDWLKDVVPDWIEAAKAWAFARVNDLRAWAVGWIDWLRGQLSAGIEAAKSWALARVNEAKALLRGLVDWLDFRIDTIWEVIAPWKSLFDSLIALFTPENINRTALLLGSFFPSLLALFTAPLAWVYSMISGTFVTFFCWIMASMLGTVKYTLPPPPDWLNGAGGIFTPGPPGPDPSGGELSSPLGSLRISGYRFGPGHPGLDLGLAGGDPVYAMHDGEVEVSGWSTVGYGNTITLRGGKWWTRYAHLQSFGVGKGDTVKQRQKIAQGDTTGNSTGNHLHLEIKKNGVFIDPEAVLF